jgi:hypothetical protein
MSDSHVTAFTQSPPQLGNQYTDDRVLRSYLARTLAAEELTYGRSALERVGALAGGELSDMQRSERLFEPRLE